MNQYKLDEFDQGFRSISKKFKLNENEKQEMLQQINKKIDLQPLTKMRKQPINRYPYYAALTTAIILLFILISPSFIEILNRTGFHQSMIDISNKPEISIAAAIGPILVVMFLSFIGFICFYFVFKPQPDDDESFLEMFGYETVFFLIFIIILSICKKLLPKNLYMLVFRTIVFMLGIGVFYLIFKFWTGVFNGLQ